jgi:hypothetical protein
MKLLTIHRPAVGAADDFCHGIDGELCIAFSITCDNPRCGCDRAAVGLNSGKSSTTVRVSEVDLDHDDAALAVMGYLNNTGWWKLFDSPAEIRQAANKFVLASHRVARDYPEDTVLRPRYDRESNSWVFTAVV